MVDFNELDELYRDIILDHYRSPRNRRSLDQADLAAHGSNPFCGDEVDLKARLDAQGRIAEVAFKGRGCSISQASTSIMTELLKGRTLEEAEALYGVFRRLMQGEELTEDEEDELGELAALAGVRKYPVRIKCALLGWTVLNDAIEDHQKAQ